MRQDRKQAKKIKKRGRKRKENKKPNVSSLGCTGLICKVSIDIAYIGYFNRVRGGTEYKNL